MLVSFRIQVPLPASYGLSYVLRQITYNYPVIR